MAEDDQRRPKVRRFTRNEEEEEALSEKMQRFWEKFSSNNSPKSISSPCSRSKEDGCCKYCPMNALRGRNLQCASAWTEKQAGALKYMCRRFPPFIDDHAQFDDYYRHLTDTRMTLLSCFTPIVQWLFNSVRVKTPAGVVHAVPVSVSDAVKGEIQSELEESDFLKIVVKFYEETRHMSMEEMNRDVLASIITNANFSEIPEHVRTGVICLVMTWLDMCLMPKLLEEEQLHKFISRVMVFVCSIEGNLRQTENFEINTGRSARRYFEMSGKRIASETDVELVIQRKVPVTELCQKDKYKLLIMCENKVYAPKIDVRSYPQMICQFSSAAKDSPFETDDHYITYGVSMIGIDSVLLTRAHVCKEMLERKDKCLEEEPVFAESYLFHRLCLHDDVDVFDLIPLITVYLAIKSVYLLDKKVNEQ
ncbi:uncharacterized protein LOC144434436 [Glandiceps talaboti]